MTVDESERMFREQAFTDAGNARQQAARGTFDPGLSQLHPGQADDPQAARRLDGHARRPRAWREFHDRFLSYGGPPIPLVRRQMLGADEGELF